MPKAGFNRSAAVLVAIAAVATPASASDGTSLTIFARVPTVCQVSVAASPAQPFRAGTNNLGVMTELCNSMAGYTVTLNHPAGLTDAWVEVGNARVPLSATVTHTIIVDAASAEFRERPLRLVLSEDDLPEGSIALSIDAQAKGPVF